MQWTSLSISGHAVALRCKCASLSARTTEGQHQPVSETAPSGATLLTTCAHQWRGYADGRRAIRYCDTTGE